MMDLKLRNLALVFAGIVAVSSALELTIEVSQGVVMEDEDITVQCRVQDFEVGTLLNWWKKQGSELVQMGSSNALNELFQERYSVDVQQTDTNVLFFLNIRGVRVEDSGEFGCSFASVADSTQFIPLSVYSPVKELHLFAMRSNNTNEEPIREYKNGEEIFFQEEDQYYFRCLASGSNPAATMDITLGYGDNQDDLSEIFVREDAEVVDQESGQVGMRRVTYTSAMTTTEPVTIRKYANSLELRCTASVSSQEEPLSVYVTPVLKFAPQVTCPKSVKHPAYTNHFALQCDVVADPPVTEAVWFWMYDDGSNTTLRIGQFYGHYSFDMLDGVKPDTKAATLMLDRVYPQMFRRYVLVVKNAKGEAKAIVNLVRDKGRETGTSGASALTSALALTLVCGLLARLGWSS